MTLPNKVVGDDPKKCPDNLVVQEIHEMVKKRLQTPLTNGKSQLLELLAEVAKQNMENAANCKTEDKRSAIQTDVILIKNEILVDKLFFLILGLAIILFSGVVLT